MKKIVFACLSLAVLFMSCSDDDSSPTGNNSPLVSTTQKIYENGELDEIITSEYDNGKITKLDFFTADNVLTGYEEIFYNNDGLLTSVNSYFGTALYSSIEYNYDNQGRMTSSHQQSEAQGVDYTRTFTHNSDNTITSTSTNSWEQSKTFYLNSSGIIYKEVSGTSIYELTLNGDTPISLSYNGALTTFEHDAEHDPSLINMNLGPGNFKPNIVLRANRLSNAILSISDKYITKETYDFSVNKYVYTFNEQGLPVKSMDYYNDILVSQMEYFYE
jgi:YD repeat-containing protein